jgi:myo-inositol catabolism protein IolC
LNRKHSSEDTCVRENIIEMDVYEMGIQNKAWIYLNLDTVKRWVVLNTTINLRSHKAQGISGVTSKIPS